MKRLEVFFNYYMKSTIQRQFYSLILARILQRVRARFRGSSEKQYVLRLPVEREVIVVDLDGGATVLYDESASVQVYPRAQWRRTTYLRDEDLVAGLHAGGYPLAVLVKGARADGQDLGLVEVLHGALGEDDARGSLGLGLYPLDQDAVEKGSNGLDGLDRGRLEG